MQQPDNLVALHYQITGRYVVDASPLEIQPLDKWALSQIMGARRIIADMVEYAECNDPENPHIGQAKAFLAQFEKRRV